MKHSNGLNMISEVPLKITFRDFDSSDAIRSAIQKRVDHLGHLFDRILNCEVVVSAPHRHHNKGKIFHVQIHLHVPGQVVHITRNPEKNLAHQDVYVALRDAFDAAERKLEDFIRVMRREVKQHKGSPHGKVVKVFPELGYGFIRSEEGREIYFDEACLVNGAIEELEVGQEVKFQESMGEKGPQASTLHCVGKTKKNHSEKSSRT